MAGKAYGPEKSAEAWRKGHVGLPGGDVHTTIGSTQAYEDGKRMRQRLEALRTVAGSHPDRRALEVFEQIKRDPRYRDLP